MNSKATIKLLPLGKTVIAPLGTPLQDLLFGHGVEFPCGGRGLCKGCRIRVLEGRLPVTDEDRRRLSEADLAAGWRLGCRALLDEDLTLELAQWESAILTDETTFQFAPRDGLGVAVDLGTTTIVAQLLDLRSGNVLAVRTGLNSQARHGADIMSRVEFAMSSEGRNVLTRLVRDQVGSMIRECLEALPFTAGTLKDVVIVGNTAMHHLFCGVSVEPLSQYPFEPTQAGLMTFSGGELGWDFASTAVVHFLPCPGGFVGSDILAGVLATGLHSTSDLSVLVDLGTNGEIVVGNKDRMVCTSTAAGPAFEGARISMGMRAATGAISEVRVANEHLHCHVIGAAEPRGICGSGLVDAAAACLDLGWVTHRGRIARGDEIMLLPPVTLTQWDIRELQLAKGAIAAGLRLLLNGFDASLEQVVRVYLAGAFGNYITYASARRIGLLPFPEEKVVPAGNTALLGAKMALFHLQQEDPSYSQLLANLQHVSLKEDPKFQDAYVEEMVFP